MTFVKHSYSHEVGEGRGEGARNSPPSPTRWERAGVRARAGLASASPRATAVGDWYDEVVEQAVQHEHDDAEDVLPVHEADLESETSVVSDEREPQGVADADELLLSQLEDLSDEGGLDVEAGVIGGIDPAGMVDGEEESDTDDDAGPRAGMEDASLGIDATDDDGWLKESEGDSSLYQSDFVDDEPDGHGDDGGLEGTETAHGAEDPLHDGLDDGALPPLPAGDDGEDAVVEEIEQELLREIDWTGTHG